jgi:hypothetical protein
MAGGLGRPAVKPRSTHLVAVDAFHAAQQELEVVAPQLAELEALRGKGEVPEADAAQPGGEGG